MKIGQCKLCLQKKKLVRKSHIIPNFMYTGMFNEKHKINHVESDNYQKVRVTQSGIWESNLFCQECDSRVFGGLELYASKALYGGVGLLPNECPVFMEKNIQSIPYILVKGISYKKFKLFLLSLIYRASISRHSFFATVDLGFHEEILRQVLIENTAPVENKYRVAIVTFSQVLDKEVFRIIREPAKHKCSGKTMYSMFINGGLYLFEISEDYPLDIFSKATIKEDNTMVVPILKYSVIEFFRLLGFNII